MRSIYYVLPHKSHCSAEIYKVKSNKSTSSAEEDWRYAVETWLSTSSDDIVRQNDNTLILEERCTSEAHRREGE